MFVTKNKLAISKELVIVNVVVNKKIPYKNRVKLKNA